MSRHVDEKKHAEPASSQRPTYARVLMLQHIHPGPVSCFFLFEGSITFAVLLSLLGLVSWWGVLVLPVLVAVMVKLNDVVSGLLQRRSV